MCSNLLQEIIMVNDEISVRIRRKTYDWLMKYGGKSIKDTVDELIECNKTHVVQTVVGRILTGNAGLTKVHKQNGYVVMLCTTDSKERFVDLVLTKEQLVNLRDVLELET